MNHPADIDALRNRLADKLESHPEPCWSDALTVAMLGLFDAHALTCGYCSGQDRPKLTLVPTVKFHERLHDAAAHECRKRLDAHESKLSNALDSSCFELAKR